MAYFDNTATTFPKPEEVYRKMDEFYRLSGGSAGRGSHTLSQNTGALLRDTRERIGRVLDAGAKQVIFTATATIALNMVIQGVIEKGARTVYISPFEHNAVTRVLHQDLRRGREAPERKRGAVAQNCKHQTDASDDG